GEGGRTRVGGRGGGCFFLPASVGAGGGGGPPPRVSLRVAEKHRPAVFAAPAPPLDPDGIWFRFQAFFVGRESKPNANSCVVTLPSIIAPASRNLRTTVESSAGT